MAGGTNIMFYGIGMSMYAEHETVIYTGVSMNGFSGFGPALSCKVNRNHYNLTATCANLFLYSIYPKI